MINSITEEDMKEIEQKQESEEKPKEGQEELPDY